MSRRKIRMARPKRSRGSCTRLDASLKRKSTDLRSRASASFATRRDTSLSTARDKEQEERQNEEIPAGKVRHESVARGKLQDEVSSPTATHEETKTKEVRNPLPQTTLGPFFRSKDFSDWMMNREYFLKYS
jgi:hypothetical protein